MPISETGRKPIREGLFTPGLQDQNEIALLGTRCSQCGEVSLGSNDCCPNCGADAVAHIPLARHGTLWTYTVARHRPPGNYQGPDPFRPFAMGLVELPDGIRILSRIDVEPGDLAIGMSLELNPFVLRTDENGSEIIGFSFQPVRGF